MFKKLLFNVKHRTQEHVLKALRMNVVFVSIDRYLQCCNTCREHKSKLEELYADFAHL